MPGVWLFQLLTKELKVGALYLEVHAECILFGSAMRLIAQESILIIARSSGALSTEYSIVSWIHIGSEDCQR